MDFSIKAAVIILKPLNYRTETVYQHSSQVIFDFYKIWIFRISKQCPVGGVCLSFPLPILTRPSSVSVDPCSFTPGKPVLRCRSDVSLGYLIILTRFQWSVVEACHLVDGVQTVANSYKITAHNCP